MPRRIKTPDGQVHLFPDEATDAQIQEALSSVSATAPASKPAPSLVERGLDWLPAAGGTVGGILGGVGGTAFGLGFGGVPGAIGGAGLGGATGEALRELGRRILGENTPGTPLQAAKQIATEGATQGAFEAGGAGAAKLLQPVARGVMRGYLKPSLAGTKVQKAREIVQTAIDEALPVTKGGEARAGRLINELNKQINGVLQGVKGKVDLRQVADKVRAFAKAKYFKPGIDNADYEAALAVADAIDNHPSLNVAAGKVTKVNATGANEIKQAVRPNSRAYGQQGAAVEATTRKVAGSQMRQGIEDVARAGGHPEVGALNAREGRLIDAQEAIKRAAAREENKGLNPTAVPNLISMGVGGGEFARERDPYSAATYALATRMALSPAVMTRAAIYASKLGKNGYSIAAAARLAVQAALSESEQ